MLNLNLNNKLSEKNTWTPASDFIGVRVRFSRVEIIEIPLCKHDEPRLGSYAMSRRLEGFTVAPSIFIKDLGKWYTKGQGYSHFSPYEFLCLCNADQKATEYLERI